MFCTCQYAKCNSDIKNLIIANIILEMTPFVMSAYCSDKSIDVKGSVSDMYKRFEYNK